MIEKSLKVGVIQQPASADRDSNSSRAVAAIHEAAEAGARLILLQELYAHPYFCQVIENSYFDLAESIPGPATEELGTLAKQLGIVIVAPIFEKRAAGLYHNTAVIIDANGTLAGKYRKMHIPDDPGYYEKYYFTPGDLGYKSFETKYGKIGTLICWDQWYPEAARLTALKGANIIFYPTAIGWHPDEKAKHGKLQYESWLTVQRGHAIANGVYVAAANRIGLEKLQDDSAGIEFWGQSFICDPQGVILAQASADKEEIIYTEVDPDRIEIVRRNWPFFRDRRIDSYGEITKRFLDG